MEILAGIDIGGTKCAVSIGKYMDNGSVKLIDKIKYPTIYEPDDAIEKFIECIDKLVKKHGFEKPDVIGISCGSPLDSKNGVILAPPNLPKWDNIDIVARMEKVFDVPCGLQNDANACALAEWYWGAGKGTNNMIFITFGTGFGAGLILNKRLYEGTTGMAGEIGHVRITDDGPEGYGKFGSVEGYCSGSGIARYAQPIIKKWHAENRSSILLDANHHKITAKEINEAASAGDELALKIFRGVGRNLGRSISILIDILNPEIIVIGSIFVRAEHHLRKSMEKVIHDEALIHSRCVCKILPAKLGEKLGDYAALCVAHNRILNLNKSSKKELV